MPITRRPNASVVLLSGGLDSYTAAAIARSEGFALYALTVRYGQRHARELEAARASPPRSASRGISSSTRPARHRRIVADLGRCRCRATAIWPRPAFPSPTCRRATPFSCRWRSAGPRCSSARDIVIGVNALDYSGYPDCRPGVHRAPSRSWPRWPRAPGVEGARFRVHTPLIALTKAEIIRRGLALGLDYGLTHSCYDPAPDGSAVRPLRQLRAAGPRASRKPASPIRCSCAKIVSALSLRFFNSSPSVVRSSQPRVAAAAPARCGRWRGRPTARDSNGEAESSTKRPVIAATAAAQLDHYFAGLDCRGVGCSRGIRSSGRSTRTRVDQLFADPADDQPLVLNLVLTAPDGRVSAQRPHCRRDVDRIALPRYIAGGRSGESPSSATITRARRQASHGDVAYPVRDAPGCVVGVLGLGVDLARFRRCSRAFRCRKDPSSPLTDPAAASSPEAATPSTYIGRRSARRGRRRPTCRRTQSLERIWTASSGSTATPLSIAARGTVSVGIPTQCRGGTRRAAVVAKPRDRHRRRRPRSCSVAVAVMLSLRRRHLNRLRIGGAADRRRRSVAARAERRRISSSRQLQDAFVTMAANLRRRARRAGSPGASRSARCTRCCNRFSARSCGRSGWPPWACWCPASRTS